MKKYHVYGLGNALVDFDFEVSLESIQRLKLDKGVMTLIDEDKHHELLEELDGIKHVKACGGSGANTIVAIAQLGGNTFYSCKVAADPCGDFYLQDLLGHNVSTNLTRNQRQAGVTGKCIVMVTPDADRTMNTHLGITENFSVAELDYDAIERSEYLYIEGYLVASTTAKDAAIKARQHAREHGTKTAITLSDVNMTKYFKEGLHEMIDSKVDLLFCNEDEALIFSDTGNLSSAEAHLKEFSATFIITHGADGCTVFDGSKTTHIPPVQTTAIDTVGAGDMFAGAFLYGITHQLDYQQAGQFANYAASKIVSKYG